MKLSIIKAKTLANHSDDKLQVKEIFSSIFLGIDMIVCFEIVWYTMDLLQMD